jgi:hypothetical protein
MLFIADKRIPEEALHNLKTYGDVLELYVPGVTYEAIAGHPDIFFCKVGSKLISAPNLPGKYIDTLSKNKIDFIIGKTNVGAKYPASAVYNAVVTGKYLIHKLDITDEVIFSYAGSIKKINAAQGYCRCNLLPLKEGNFITSDEGILKTLSGENLDVLYINPQEVIKYL